MVAFGDVPILSLLLLFLTTEDHKLLLESVVFRSALNIRMV